MINTFGLPLRVRWRLRATSLAVLVPLIGMSGQALAARSQPASAFSGASPLPSVQAPALDQPVMTPRGPAFITGHLGALETTTIPGSVGQGLLINNGNGTSTLVAPGSTPQTAATPR